MRIEREVDSKVLLKPNDMRPAAWLYLLTQLGIKTGNKININWKEVGKIMGVTIHIDKVEVN